MVDRLTRRERAAMQLALELLRGSVPVRVTGRLRSSPDFREGQSHCVDDAKRALRIGDPGLSGLWLDLGEALADRDTPRRLIRARLALYLRARLRADRGDLGRWWAVDFPKPVGGRRVARFADRMFADSAARVGGGTVRRVKGPWWEQPDMPAHEVER